METRVKVKNKLTIIGFDDMQQPILALHDCMKNANPTFCINKHEGNDLETSDKENEIVTHNTFTNIEVVKHEPELIISDVHSPIKEPINNGFSVSIPEKDSISTKPKEKYLLLKLYDCMKGETSDTVNSASLPIVQGSDRSDIPENHFNARKFTHRTGVPTVDSFTIKQKEKLPILILDDCMIHRGGDSLKGISNIRSSHVVHENDPHVFPNHIDAREFECYQCKKTFTNETFLHVHMQMHSKLLQCKVCKRIFVSQSMLEQHLNNNNLNDHRRKSQSLETCFQCYRCKNCFRYVKDCRRHLSSTCFRSLACAYSKCGKVFLRKNDLKVHSRIHSGEQPYESNYQNCGRIFTQNTHFNRHVRDHKNEKVFAFKQDLIKHMRTHVGDKPFLCDYQKCGKAFNQRCNLMRHKTIHMGENGVIPRFL